jgi:quercetin dioxygenase-like cupin family protein
MSKGKVVGSEDGNLYRRKYDMFVKVTADDTGGAYEVCEERCPPGCASRRHIHARNHETFFVLEGGAKFVLGDETHEGIPGSLFHIPPGLPHQVFAGDDGVRMLMVYSPGETEAMFKDMVALTREQPADFETGRAVAARHNTIWLSD